MKSLTHLDEDGHPRMVNVGEKPDTNRMARAEGTVRMSAEALARISSGAVAKGDVLAIARLAGIQGAKRTSDLIPLCHPLPIDGVEVVVEACVNQCLVRIESVVRTRWRTGVEMEALMAVNAAALTIYDMVKSIDRGMSIEGVRLLEKRGGRSGVWKAE